MGSLWGRFDLAIQDQDDPSTCNYMGENANREWRELSGCESTVPVKHDFLSGCIHWDETCLNTESMSRFIEADGSNNKVSKITLGALEDIGYTVDYSKADDFTSDDISESCRCNSRRLGQELPSTSTHTTMVKSMNHKQIFERSRHLGPDDPRQPGQDAEDNAIAFGLKILRERKSELHGFQGASEHDSIDVSHEVLSVVFIEDDQLFSVEVSGDSIE